MMLHMLDTNTASDLIAARPSMIEAGLSQLHPSAISISSITRAELLYELKPLPASDHLHLAVQKFFKLVRILPWDIGAADWYAEIRHQCDTLDLPLGELDIMMVSQAISAGAVLVTRNKDIYQRLDAPLLMQNWSVTQPPA